MAPVDVQSPVIQQSTNGQRQRVLYESDPGYLEHLVEEEFKLNAELAKIIEMERQVREELA